jgi:hypothetical protein
VVAFHFIIFPHDVTKIKEQSSQLYKNPRKGVAMWFISGNGFQQINDVQWALLILETSIKIDWKTSCLFPTCFPLHLNPLQFVGNRNKHPYLVFCIKTLSLHLCTCSHVFFLDPFLRVMF